MSVKARLKKLERKNIPVVMPGIVILREGETEAEGILREGIDRNAVPLIIIVRSARPEDVPKHLPPT